MKQRNLNLVSRIQEPTPKWFRIVRNIGLALSAVGGVLVAAPVALPAAVVSVGGYLLLGGDSLKVKQEFTQERREIRLYGLDAPEVHFSRKMREDEAKTGIPASLLLQYGLMSLDYVLQVCPPKTRITLLTELANRTDFWLRDLAYVILPSGECLNELLISNGFAKASNSYYCFHLHYFQEICRLAQLEKQGIYQFSNIF